MVGKRLSINDDWLMINDFVHTENTDGYGGPQADDGGEQQLSKIGQQLKGNYWLFTHYIFSAVFIKLRKCLMNDYWLLITDEWLLIAEGWLFADLTSCGGDDGI